MAVRNFAVEVTELDLSESRASSRLITCVPSFVCTTTHGQPTAYSWRSRRLAVALVVCRTTSLSKARREQVPLTRSS